MVVDSLKGKTDRLYCKTGGKNLYHAIRQSTEDYFNGNGISWWRGTAPSGHVLSSQIACLNHLFAIKDDKETVLAMLKGVKDDIVDVLPIPYDKECHRGYIAFEVVSNKDYLNEDGPTRGANCTSVDAFIYATDKFGKKWLVPIEWKYTEFYTNADKSTEDRNGEPKGTNGKGNERMSRYNALITDSKQLKSLEEYQGSAYYREPFYQLMRQTLWAELVVNNKDIDVEEYLHIHVIPSKNKTLLDKQYKVSGKDMESTWRDMIECQEKYMIIDPADLMEPITHIPEYKELCEYLAKRYW